MKLFKAPGGSLGRRDFCQKTQSLRADAKPLASQINPAFPKIFWGPQLSSHPLHRSREKRSVKELVSLVVLGLSLNDCESLRAPSVYWFGLSFGTPGLFRVSGDESRLIPVHGAITPACEGEMFRG